MAAAHCASLWIGDALGTVERACLRSAVRHGHRLTLYGYSRISGVPDGVDLADASAIIPKDRIFRHRSGSFAPFSDWFRYELQRRCLGTWIDTDVYCVAPIPGGGDYLFGKQQPGKINNAVLRLPPDSPLLPPLLDLFESGRLPAWLPLRPAISLRLARLVGSKADPGRLPWGSTGPDALTALARTYGLTGKALPPTVFYPVRWEDSDWIRDPGISLQSRLSPGTLAVHLWNDRIKGFKDQPAPPGSFLHQLQSEGG